MPSAPACGSLASSAVLTSRFIASEPPDRALHVEQVVLDDLQGERLRQTVLELAEAVLRQPGEHRPPRVGFVPERTRRHLGDRLPDTLVRDAVPLDPKLEVVDDGFPTF